MKYLYLKKECEDCKFGVLTDAFQTNDHHFDGFWLKI